MSADPQDGTTLRHYPLGQRVPDSPHAVCVSLPSLADVIGYEEKDPATVQAMASGYPRFKLPAYVEQLTRHTASELGDPPRDVLLLNSDKAAAGLLDYLDEPAAKAETADAHAYVHFPAEPDAYARAFKFLQHTGCGLSSRQAEHHLLQEGLLDQPFPEALHPGDAQATVLEQLTHIAGTPAEDILLTNSGMNAFYAAFLATREIQRPRGRTLWIQLGWLYLDTSEILQKFLGPEERHIQHLDVFDLDGLEQLFTAHPGQVAALITEAPTNPLLQTPDLPRIHELASQHGALLITDPTSSTPANIDLLPHADLLANSLTKYAGNQGDLLAGALLHNPASPFYEDLKELTPLHHEPPHTRDLQRLAHEIQDYPETLDTINRNALALAELLDAHPAVRKLHWAYSPPSKDNYQKLAKRPDAPGGLLTIELEGALTDFYDPIRLLKSPSFGTRHSMICPFMYLAHYDLVSTPEGRQHLAHHHIDPELIRIAVGTEPTDQLLQVFKEALDNAHPPSTIPTFPKSP